MAVGATLHTISTQTGDDSYLFFPLCRQLRRDRRKILISLRLKTGTVNVSSLPPTKMIILMIMITILPAMVCSSYWAARNRPMMCSDPLARSTDAGYHKQQ